MTAEQIIQLMGVLYLITGISFIFNKKYYRNLFKDVLKSNIFKFFGGYIALATGFVLILFFNELSFSKEWLITILWWMGILKWFILLMSPNFFWNFSKFFTKKENFNLVSFFIIIMWLLLIYLGYFG